jgi:hypothetical protein
MHAEVYNLVWDKLDQAMEEKRLVGCRRLAADPFSDKNSDRLGIKLGIDHNTSTLTHYNILSCRCKLSSC